MTKKKKIIKNLFLVVSSPRRRKSFTKKKNREYTRILFFARHRFPFFFFDYFSAFILSSFPLPTRFSVRFGNFNTISRAHPSLSPFTVVFYTIITDGVFCFFCNYYHRKIIGHSRPPLITRVFSLLRGAPRGGGGRGEIFKTHSPIKLVGKNVRG